MSTTTRYQRIINILFIIGLLSVLASDFSTVYAFSHPILSQYAIELNFLFSNIMKNHNITLWFLILLFRLLILLLVTVTVKYFSNTIYARRFLYAYGMFTLVLILDALIDTYQLLFFELYINHS
jgi:hypothetical protein